MIAERRMIQPDPEDLFDTKQAMDYLNVGGSTIYNAKAMQQLETKKIGGRLYFTRVALDTYRRVHMQTQQEEEEEEVQRPTLVPSPLPEPEPEPKIEMEPKPEEELLTATEAAEYLERTTALVYHARKNSKLEGILQPDGRFLYRKQDLDDYRQTVASDIQREKVLRSTPPFPQLDPVPSLSSNQEEEANDKHEGIPEEPHAPLPQVARLPEEIIPSFPLPSEHPFATISSVINQMIQQHVESSLHAYTEELVRERAKSKQLIEGMKEVRTHIDRLIQEYEERTL